MVSPCIRLLLLLLFLPPLYSTMGKRVITPAQRLATNARRCESAARKLQTTEGRFKKKEKDAVSELS